MTTDPDRPAVPGLEPADRCPSEDDGLFFVPEEHPRAVEPAPEAARPGGPRAGSAPPTTPTASTPTLTGATCAER